MEKSRTKRIFSLIAAAALLIAAVACLPLTAGASSAPMALWVKQDGITPDGDLSDWPAGDTIALGAYDAESGKFVESEGEWCRFAWSPDSLYFAMVVKDVKNTMDGLLRDHFRLSVVLPDGSIGLFYSDEDGWNCMDDACTWWGFTGTKAFTQGNTTAKFAYREDGTIAIEGRACLTDAARAYLKDGTELKIALQYFDHMACNTGTYDGARWASYGATVICPIKAEQIGGTLKLVERMPEPQEVFTYEAKAVKGGSLTDIDGEFDEWGTAEKQMFDRYDPARGVFVKSTDEYVQFQYVYGQLYFRVHAKDDGFVLDQSAPLTRDQVRLTVFFPGDERAFMYFDTDNWYEPQAGAWFGLGGGDGNKAEAENAALRDNSNSAFRYADGFIDMEGRINVREECRDYFVNGKTFKAAIEYLDGQTCNGAAYDGKSWLKWGTTALVAIEKEQVTGTVTLFDPDYQELDDVTVQQPTDGAKNAGYTFGADGMTVRVEPTAGAASYRAYVFDRWGSGDDTAYIANHWVDAEGTSLTVTKYEDDGDYAYQVVALDAEGKVLAVYPVVDFVGGKEAGSGDDQPSGDDKPAGDDKSSGDNEPGKSDEPSVAPETGVALPIAAAAVLGGASAAAAVLRKKRG